MPKEKKLIPELRFPEFANSAEWEVKSLEDVLDYERPDKYIVANTDYQNEGIPVLTANKSFILGHTKEDFGIYNNLPAIIFDDFTVDSKFVDFPFKVKSSAIKILTPKNSDNLRFIYELISQIKFDAKEHKRYYISEYQKLKLPFPNPQEQQKIASCLSSLDEVITAHSQKLELLKNHKKGLMQNLFPKENEKVPKLRFKEFEGEWEKTTIDEIAKVSAGGTPESTNPEYWNGDIPWMNSGELNNKRIYSVSNFITSKGLKESSTKLIPPKCVLIGLAGQGKTRGTAAINYIELCTNQSIGSIHPNEDVFDSEFLYQRIDSMYEKLRYLSAGDGGRGGLNLQIIKEIEVLLPKKKEQQKIASCLSALDELITAQAEKIEQLKQHKKGLMQGLFPSLSLSYDNDNNNINNDQTKKQKNG